MSDVTVIVRMEKKVFSDGFYVYAIVQSSTVSSLYDIFVHTRYIDGTVQFLRVAELTDVDGGGLTAANLLRVYVPGGTPGIAPVLSGWKVRIDVPWPFNWIWDLHPYLFPIPIYDTSIQTVNSDGAVDLDVLTYDSRPLVPGLATSYNPFYNEHILGNEVNISIHNGGPMLQSGIPAQILYTPAATTTWLQRAVFEKFSTVEKAKYFVSDLKYQIQQLVNCKEYYDTDFAGTSTVVFEGDY